MVRISFCLALINAAPFYGETATTMVEKFFLRIVCRFCENFSSYIIKFRTRLYTGPALCIVILLNLDTGPALCSSILK